LAAIRPLDQIPSRYLLFYIRSVETWLATQGIGSTFTAISKSDLEELKVRLAPLNEQRRIVAKLEKV
jgi:type I restriction enzyme S subunit